MSFLNHNSHSVHSAPSPPSPSTHQNSPSIDHDVEKQPPPSPPPPPPPPTAPIIDYKARAQWLRAAVLGANDGLVSVASLMIGVGAVNQSHKAMLVSGLAGLVAGACSMAIGEFVSVYTQYDIELEARKKHNDNNDIESGPEEESLPRPLQAAGASALAFAVGALLPLLAGGFITNWGVRVGVVFGVASLGLAGFGGAGAVLGGASVRRSAIRVLVGGWLAMLVTYGVLRIVGIVFKMDVSSST